MSKFLRVVIKRTGEEVYINADKIAVFRKHDEGGTLISMDNFDLFHIKEEPEHLEGRLSYLYDKYPEPF